MQKYVPLPLAYCSENFRIISKLFSVAVSDAQKPRATRSRQSSLPFPPSSSSPRSVPVFSRLVSSRLVLLFVHPAHRPHRRHTPSSLSHSRALTPSLSSSRARVVVISPIHSTPCSSHPSSRARALGRSRARSFGPSRRSRRTGRRANVRAASRLRSRASHRRRHRRRRRRPHRSHRHRDVKGSGRRGRDAGGRARGNLLRLVKFEPTILRIVFFCLRW